MIKQNLGVLYGIAGSCVDIALTIVEFFFVKKGEVLTKWKILVIQILTFTVLWCGIYLFSLMSQFFRFRHVIYDENLVGIFIGTFLFFLIGSGHFERLKPQQRTQNDNEL